MGILALTTYFVTASSPKASMKRVVGLALEWAFVELNVDASLDHDLLRGTMGAVLRDDKGKFIRKRPPAVNLPRAPTP